jgi:hypothetical protein
MNQQVSKNIEKAGISGGGRTGANWERATHAQGVTLSIVTTGIPGSPLNLRKNKFI